MRRFFGGLVLVAHGLAHALPATQAGSAGVSWLLTPAGVLPTVVRWAVAVTSAFAIAGFVAAGFGVWGAPPFRRYWRALGKVAATASALLLVLFWVNPYGVVGLALDVAIVLALRRVVVVRLAPEPLKPVPPPGTRAFHAVVKGAALLFVLWMFAVSLAAPRLRFWGSTPEELALSLPGDEPLDGPATYWIQHAVSVRAPPAVVWPWLAQIGSDRAGFYSYDGLERLMGLDVRNADRIHPEWQERRTGGFVLAAPPGWMGFQEPLGWQLGLVDPDRVMVLDGWGAFVLRPRGADETRLIIRTRNAAPPSLLALALSWVDLALFQPGHFAMERRMLLGVKRRAEGTIRGTR